MCEKLPILRAVLIVLSPLSPVSSLESLYFLPSSHLVWFTRAAERLEVGAPPTDATLTNQNIPKPRIEPSGNEAPELIMASQANISPSSSVDSLQAASFASSDVSSSGVDLPTRTIPPSTSLNSQPGATIPPGAKPVSADSQTTSKPRKCGCKCSTDCNCVCLPHTCSQGCDANCLVNCDKKCGSASFRNLVVCLDWTSNQFGHRVCRTLRLAVSYYC